MKAQAPAIEARKQPDGSYFVDSQTYTLVAYRVRCNWFGVWECCCWQYYRKAVCKHCGAVLKAEGLVVEAPAEIVPVKAPLTLEEVFERAYATFAQ